MVTESSTVHHPLATADAPPSGRVAHACERCRKQKLKCDAVRPCTLCRHSGFTCQPRENNHTVKRNSRRKRLEAKSSLGDNVQTKGVYQTQENTSLDSCGLLQIPRSPQSGTTERRRFGANNSAVGFAAKMLGSPGSSQPNDILNIPGHNGRSAQTLAGACRSWSLVTMRRPPATVIEVLLDTFFDRMQWFVLLFHEPSFRRAVRSIFSSGTWRRKELGTIIACLTACAIGLQCAARDPSWPGHRLLAESSLEPRSLLDALIKEIRFHLLDLLDDCCIETVQVCNLLGAYYMFHASPTLAWSILGMAVRTAYALALYYDDGLASDPVVAQVRRRNWNHITVSDTFSAMIYGRPVSLDAAFSFVLPVYDIDDTNFELELRNHPLLAPGDCHSSSVTKLTFHTLKFRLYEIVREALNRFRVLRLHNPISLEDLLSIVKAVQHIRSLLKSWRESLPPVFDFEPGSHEPILGDLASVKGLSAESQKACKHLADQVLTLQVAYDSSIISIHRPLLEYRVAAGMQKAVPYEARQVVAESLDLSVSAALRMSRIPVAELENQFVISFILMSFFTAGVILCIPPTTWPMSPIANESKAGILRIIRANRNLKKDSQIAAHTEQLLTGLLKRSLLQEVENGLQQGDINNPGLDYFPKELERGPTYGEAQHPSGRSMQPSVEPESAITDQGFSFRSGITDESVPLLQASSDAIYNEDHVFADFDFKWPIAGQCHQVDSQLGEAFGTFGQMLFNLVPDDPYSAWSWGSGGP